MYLALADVTTARHLLREIDDVLLHRPDLGTLVDEVAEFRSTASRRRDASGAAGGPPLTPAELRLLPYLQTHLTFPEIAGRLYVSHNTVRSQVGSIYRKLGVSARSDAVQHATAIGLLGGLSRRSGLLPQGRLGVVAEGEPKGWRGGDDAREPDDRDETDEDVDDLGRRRTRIDGRVALGTIGRQGAADRDQRGEADEFEGLRIERRGSCGLEITDQRRQPARRR